MARLKKYWIEIQPGRRFTGFNRSIHGVKENKNIATRDIVYKVQKK
jgi:hypothetical protein